MKFLIPIMLVAGVLGQSTSNDFQTGGCKGVVFAYARASTEGGNIGSSLGPPLKRGLRTAFDGDVAMQGLNGYSASLADNFQTGGSSQRSINSMVNLLTEITTKCPSAKVAVGGYSQGTAVAARAIEKLGSGVTSRIGAVVLFGYTQNQQLRGGVPNIPQENVKVFCNDGDRVCEGTLTIAGPHFNYGGKVDEAVAFIKSRLG